MIYIERTIELISLTYLFSSLGKSSMTIQFVENVFVDSYYPTIENTFTKPISHQGQEYAAEIIDTAGQVRYIEPRSSSGSYLVDRICLSIFCWREGFLICQRRRQTRPIMLKLTCIHPSFLELLGRVFNLQWKARIGYSWLHLSVLCDQQTEL